MKGEAVMANTVVGSYLQEREIPFKASNLRVLDLLVVNFGKKAATTSM